MPEGPSLMQVLHAEDMQPNIKCYLIYFKMIYSYKFAHLENGWFAIKSAIFLWQVNK